MKFPYFNEYLVVINFELIIFLFLSVGYPSSIKTIMIHSRKHVKLEVYDESLMMTYKHYGILQHGILNFNYDRCLHKNENKLLYYHVLKKYTCLFFVR